MSIFQPSYDGTTPVTDIGFGSPDVKRGVICASYNAG